MKRYTLVYQVGIANIFRVKVFALSALERRTTVRVLQADFRTCENFARGLREAGATVDCAACNEAGDIVERTWSYDFDAQPFNDKFALDFADA